MQRFDVHQRVCRRRSARNSHGARVGGAWCVSKGLIDTVVTDNLHAVAGSRVAGIDRHRCNRPTVIVVGNNRVITRTSRKRDRAVDRRVKGLERDPRAETGCHGSTCGGRAGRQCHDIVATGTVDS